MATILEFRPNHNVLKELVPLKRKTAWLPDKISLVEDDEKLEIEC